MLGGAILIWLASTSAPVIELGAEIPAGIYPAAVLLEACELLDGRPTMIAQENLGSYPIRLKVPLLISQETFESIKIALRTVGLYRINYADHPPTSPVIPGSRLGRIGASMLLSCPFGTPTPLSPLTS
jgi:hypothetical protein